MNFRRNPEYFDRLKKTAGQRLDTAAVVVRDRVRSILTRGDGHGEHYPGNPHRSSAPGESPVDQGGGLPEAMRTYGRRDEGDSLVAAAGTDLAYYASSELGTATRAPRPLLLPALLDSQDGVMAAMSGKSKEGVA